jgi:hypothetical protein
MALELAGDVDLVVRGLVMIRAVTVTPGIAEGMTGLTRRGL